MFLHLGGDVIVTIKDIIAIIDLESSTNAFTTREFLKVVDDEGFINIIGEKGREKSFILTPKNVYLSPISSYTLMKRANSVKNILESE